MPNAASNRRVSTSRTPLPGSRAQGRPQRTPRGQNAHGPRPEMRDGRIDMYFQPVAPRRNAGSPPMPPRLPANHAVERAIAMAQDHALGAALRRLGIVPGLMSLMGDEEPHEVMGLDGDSDSDSVALSDFLVDEALFDFGTEMDEGGVRVDRESTMEEGRREVTYLAAHRLRQTFTEPYAWPAVLHFFLDELRRMEEGKAPAPAPLQNMRLGVSEVKNARRTLMEDCDRDRTPPLCLNPVISIGEYGSIHLGDLLALVWTAVQRLDVSAADRRDMVNGVYRALAESIEVKISEERLPAETDGEYRRRMREACFRACPLGIAERFVSVLEGYCHLVQNFSMRPSKAGEEPLPRCTTGQLLTEFCRELRHTYNGDTPPDADLNKLYDEALTRAAQFWEPETPLGQSFKRQLRDWLERDYEPWKAPV